MSFMGKLSFKLQRITLPITYNNQPACFFIKKDITDQSGSSSYLVKKYQDVWKVMDPEAKKMTKELN